MQRSRVRSARKEFTAFPVRFSAIGSVHPLVGS
jgi:hypothetical protein